jgi:ABC-type transport system involved in multi-copper enzyme maturation permease subunit
MKNHATERRSLLSPVFWKEMITLSRRTRYFWARGLFLAILTVTVWISWHDAMRYALYSGFADLARAGNDLFRTFTVTQLIIVMILVPALTAPVIAAEKDGDTLGLLMMSNLKRGNILLDKLLSRMLLMVLLLVSVLPLFLVLLTFGGIQISDIWNAYAALFSTILFCSGLGLLFSTTMRKLYSALIATYATMVIYFLLFFYLGEEFNLYDADNFMFMMPIAPAFEEDYGLQCLMFSAVAFLLFFVISRALLPRMLAQRKRHIMKRVFDRLNAFFKRINFTGVVLMKESKPLEGNAMLWKEAHKNFFCSNIFMLRATYTLLIINLVTMAGFLLNDEIVLVVAVGQVIILGVTALVASSTAFSSEREKHSLEVLLSTPLTQKSIVVAKFLGVLRLLLPLIINILLWLTVMNIVGAIYGDYIEILAICTKICTMLLAYVPLLIVIGLFASLKRHRTVSAILQTFVTTAAWCFAPFLIFIFDAFDILYVPSDIESFVLSLAPVSGVGCLISEDLSIAACILLILVWILLFVWLYASFDKSVGRLRSA